MKICRSEMHLTMITMNDAVGWSSHPLCAIDLPRKLNAMVQMNTTKKVITLRSPQPGDMGWVVQQHGEIYAREYGWNADFEALVLDIMVRHLRRWQPEWERCWIAEVDGQRAGSVFVVRISKTVA